MKAEILMDPATTAGILQISPETPIDAYALNQWWSNFNQGDHSSIFLFSEIPAPPSEND